MKSLFRWLEYFPALSVQYALLAYSEIRVSPMEWAPDWAVTNAEQNLTRNTVRGFMTQSTPDNGIAKARLPEGDVAQYRRRASNLPASKLHYDGHKFRGRKFACDSCGRRNLSFVHGPIPGPESWVCNLCYAQFRRKRKAKGNANVCSVRNADAGRCA